MADALAALAARAPYSLELRVSLDDTDPERNDRVRGEGAWAKAVEAVRLLRERGLLPIVTATEITRDEHPAGSGMYERFRDFLHAQGVERPRVKIMPVFGLGRQPAGAVAPLTEEDLEGFDRVGAAVRGRPRGGGRRRLCVPDPGRAARARASPAAAWRNRSGPRRSTTRRA